MGIFDKVKGIFGKKKKVEAPPVERPEPLEPIPLTRTEEAPLPPPRAPLEPLPPPRLTPETQRISDDNLKAKIDLLIAELDSIKTQNRMIDERLKTIEKTLTEMRGIRYY